MTTDIAGDSSTITRALANETERGLIVELKRSLDPELSRLKDAGRDFKHTTGDIFLLRVLRGNDLDVGKAAEWYRKCLKAREDYGMDDVYLQEIKEDTLFSIDALPGNDEVGKHFRQLGDERSLRTPNGDLLQVDIMGGIRWQKFIDEVSTSKYIAWQVRVQEAKLVALDRLSEQLGRMVKCVTFVDLRHSRLPPRAFLKTEKEIKTGIFETTGVEVVHRIFFIGAPRFFYNLWSLAKPLLPKRTLASIKLLGNDFAKDADVVGEAGPHLLPRLIALGGAGDGLSATQEELAGEARLILAGDIFEVPIHVVAGQAVAWKFRIGGTSELLEAGARGRLGGLADRFTEATDLMFEVSALWDPDEGDAQASAGPADLQLAQLVASTKVDPQSGEVAGRIGAPRSGVAIVRWSNLHSMVRAKVVASYSVAVEPGGK